MKPVRALALLSAIMGLALVAPCAVRASDSADLGQNRVALANARSAAEEARHRGESFEAQAAAATAAADRSAAEAAALAARIQQAQAQIAADQATITILTHQQATLRDSLSAREWPLLRLSAALQRLGRRPLALAVLQPGSVRDAAHLRAVFASTMPEVRNRTAALRQQLVQLRALRQQALRAQLSLRSEQATLAGRKQALLAVEVRQRLAANASAGSADRETERAIALAEQARDLGGLVGALEQAAALREKLAWLPGPLIRPPRPGQSEVMAVPVPRAAEPSSPAPYRLPVAGRLVTGFGDVLNGAGPSRGLQIATAAGAQVVAPASGRVAFAGAYRGFGSIVILDHSGGWMSLVTGLGRIDVRVGDTLMGGAPLGIVGPESMAGATGTLALELRHDGQPVNPVEQMRLQ